MTLIDLASYSTIGAFLIAIGSLAYSAKRFLTIKEREQALERFQQYHNLIKTISKGTDDTGVLKLVSQIAYIYELRNFTEYSSLTKTVLNKLKEEWSKLEGSEKNGALSEAINETLVEIQTSKK